MEFWRSLKVFVPEVKLKGSDRFFGVNPTSSFRLTWYSFLVQLMSCHDGNVTSLSLQPVPRKKR